MKKVLIFLFMFMFFVTLVNAESSGGDLVGKQNECIELPQECSNCSYVNITTITLPDLSRESIQNTMEKDGSSYNYSYCSTTQLGSYIYCTIGDVDGEDTVACKDFKITTSGGDAGSVLNNPVLIIMVVLGMGLVVVGVRMGIPWFGFIGSVMFLLSGTYTMIYGLGDIADMYSRGIAITLLGMGFIFMFSSAYEWLSNE